MVTIPFLFIACPFIAGQLMVVSSVCSRTGRIHLPGLIVVAHGTSSVLNFLLHDIVLFILLYYSSVIIIVNVLDFETALGQVDSHADLSIY